LENESALRNMQGVEAYVNQARQEENAANFRARRRLLLPEVVGVQDWRYHLALRYCSTCRMDQPEQVSLVEGLDILLYQPPNYFGVARVNRRAIWPRGINGA